MHRQEWVVSAAVFMSDEHEGGLAFLSEDALADAVGIDLHRFLAVQLGDGRSKIRSFI